MLTTWLVALCIGTVYLEGRIVAASPSASNSDLNVIHEWKYFDFVFESEAKRKQAIASGEYNHANCVPIDVDRWQDKTFVTIIRDEGVPSSLNVISKKTGDGGPLLEPYPNWNWAKTDCTGITSVYRVAIDGCNRLWVLDTGVIGSKRVCSAQLLAFDLRTSNLLKRVIIPKDVAVNSTSGLGLLVTPIVQTFGPRCRNTYVYMADVEGYALLFYNDVTKTVQRFTSSALVYDPQETTYTIEGESFSYIDGPVGMALSSLSETLYLSPMSSRNLVSIETDAIMSATSNNLPFIEYKDVLSTQSSAKAMSNVGTLFFGLVNNTAIGCWNEFKPLTKRNIFVVAQNTEILQFISGMKVKQNDSHFTEEKLLLLTNRLQKVLTQTINFNETNFRIVGADVISLISNTPCALPRFGRVA